MERKVGSFKGKYKNQKSGIRKQVFEMEIDKIEEEKRRLDHLQQGLHAIMNSLNLKGDVNADDILLIM